MSEYQPYFNYRFQPGTKDDPTPKCITIPQDMTKCKFEERRISNRLVQEGPLNMKMYNDKKPVSYDSVVGFPKKHDTDHKYFNVKDLTKTLPPFHMLLESNMKYQKPTFDENEIINNYKSCKKIQCCDENTSTFNTCDTPAPKFGMAQTIYKQYPDRYKEFQGQNQWHNFTKEKFVNNGNYDYIIKQQWNNAPWSLENYATPFICHDNHEEWRTDKDRCFSSYRTCNNLFNNMTRRKSIL